MTGAQLQAARLDAKAKANAAFYAGVRPHTNATTRRAALRRGRRADDSAMVKRGKFGWSAKARFAGSSAIKVDRHIIRHHVIGTLVIKLHATKGWRLERA
jgi:hypothetical protein